MVIACMPGGSKTSHWSKICQAINQNLQTHTLMSLLQPTQPTNSFLRQALSLPSFNSCDNGNQTQSPWHVDLFHRPCIWLVLSCCVLVSLSRCLCCFTFSAPCSELHHADSGRGNKTAGTPCEAWAVKLWKLALLEPVEQPGQTKDTWHW